MTRIYIPSRGAQDWQRLLAKPDLHWKPGASAQALAEAWEAGTPWPGDVAAALTASGLGGLDLLLALPEHRTPLPGGTRASQTDLLVLARRPAGAQVVLAVEGKAAEPFGEHTVAEWRRQSASDGRRARLAFLLERLGLPDDATLAGLRYQLLHRTVAALLEAERFGAPEAVMLVHSFSPTAAWRDDYVRFAQALRARPDDGPIVPAPVPGDVALHLGWVTSPAPLVFPAPDDAVAEQLGRVVRALAAGEHEPAAAELATLAGVTRRTHPIDPMPALPRDGWPKGTHGKTHNPPAPAMAAIFVRDGFTCVYCRRRTIPPQVLRLISRAFPEQFPYHPNWKSDIAPRAYWDISTTLDHVHAVSMGGDYQDPANLVTACYRCQDQKNNLSLEILGWSVRRDGDGWSGLIEAYEPLWERLGRPDRAEHSKWIRAFREAATAAT
jgi:5-methylcytosine-specific restriction endonuclease McrA